MRNFLRTKLKYVAALFAFTLTSGISSLSPVFAYSTTNPGGAYQKVYVCKYVGTSGVNETLKTGNDGLVDVSVNSLQNFTGLGSFFNDAQGRSVAIAWDNGDGVAPSTSMCPAPQGPTKIAIPAPTPVDPCGLHNAYWVKPADTNELDWSLSFNGTLSVQTKSGYVFTDGSTSKNFGTAQDSNTPCIQQVSIPATPAVTDPCGPSNATWIKPTDTASITWTLTNGTLVATTNAGYVFTDGTTSKNFGTARDSNTPCVVTLPAKPNVTDPCGPANATWVKPADTPTVTWTITQSGHLIATAASGYIFSTGYPTNDYGVALDSNALCLISVSPTPVTFNDVCGTGHDTFTIPSKTGVTYKVNGFTFHAGTYSGVGTVTVVAIANTGYVLSGTSTWSTSFTNVPCNVTFCHANAFDSDDWGWTKVTVNDDSNFGDLVLWGHAANDNADIMPAFTYYNGTSFAGKNLSHNFDGFTGQQILDNDCKKPCPKEVTPVVVTFTEPTCQYPTLGSYTVPNTPHVIYKVGNVVVAAGVHTVTVPGSVTVKAYPESGAYTLSGTTTWSHNFVTPNGCGGGQVPLVTPATVTFTDATCSAAGFYTIPSTTGVVYKDANGTVLSAGTHAGVAGQTIKVTAYAADGYQLNDVTNVWSHTFVAVTACGGGQVLSDTTTTSVVATPVKQLADTGTSTVLPTILALSMALTATGVMIGSRQRKASTRV